jgi:hypothetical protein
MQCVGDWAGRRAAWCAKSGSGEMYNEGSCRPTRTGWLARATVQEVEFKSFDLDAVVLPDSPTSG